MYTNKLNAILLHRIKENKLLRKSHMDASALYITLHISLVCLNARCYMELLE